MRTSKRSEILRVSAGWGGNRRDAISKAISREESVRRSRRYSQEKGTMRARPLCTVVRLCRERPSARARFPLCNTSDFESIALLLIFCGKFYGTSAERTLIANEIRKLSHDR